MASAVNAPVAAAEALEPMQQCAGMANPEAEIEMQLSQSNTLVGMGAAGIQQAASELAQSQEVPAKRPRGRAPRGKAWDTLLGKWVDAPESDADPPAACSQSKAQRSAGAGEGEGEGADFEANGGVSLRDRKQSKRALERDVAAGDAMALSDDAAPSDESADETYGAAHGTKAGPKRKRSGVLQLLKRQSVPRMQLDIGTPMALPELYEPFVPLTASPYTLLAPLSLPPLLLRPIL